MNKLSTVLKEFKFFIRRKLIEKHFFKDVTFESKLHAKVLKTSILSWIFALEEYKNIKVDNFVFLLSEYSDTQISLPIRIGGCKHHLDITDSNGTKFYFDFTRIPNKNFTFYSIGTRDNNFDREFEYELTPFDTIIPYQYWVMVLNNGINTDKSFNAILNNRTHKPNIVFENDNFSLKIVFAAPNYFYAEIEKYLLTLINRTDYFYNILPVFAHIKNTLDYHLPISITCYKGSEVLSSISTYFKFANGEYVHEYSFTEFTEKESTFHKIEIEDTLSNFLEYYLPKETN